MFKRLVHNKNEVKVNIEHINVLNVILPKYIPNIYIFYLQSSIADRTAFCANILLCNFTGGNFNSSAISLFVI